MTNGDFRHFDASRRIPVELESLKFRVLNDLFSEGDEYVADLDALKQAEKKAKAQKLAHHDLRKAPRKAESLEKWG